MANLVKWIEELSGGEQIESVVIGEMGWGSYGAGGVPNYDAIPKGEKLSWESAREWLNYEFHSGFGAPGCNAIVAWSKSWVIGISQYDGSTRPFRMPRNPRDFMPEMPGG